jgi:transglutaminase-like putative cysteine protease
MKPARRLGVAAVALLLGTLCLFSVFGTQQNAYRHFELGEDYAFYFDNTDEIITVLHDSLAEHASAVTLRYTAEGNHMEQISAMIEEMMDLAMYNTASPTEGDYVRYQYGGYQLSYGYTEETGQRTYTVTIQPTYYTTVEEENWVTERVAEILTELNFNAGTSNYDKIKGIYDYVCSHVAYDHVHANNSNYHRDSTAYAALVKGSAACQGYAVALYRLLKEVGIENTVVTGTAVNEQGQEEFHAWNKVELDGVSYLLDATWDAGKEEYTYFMLTEENFPRHTADNRSNQ